MQPLPNEPQTIGGVLDAIFHTYKAVFRSVLILMIVATLFGSVFEFAMYFLPDAYLQAGSVSMVIAVIGVVTVVAWGISAYCGGAAMKRMNAILLGDQDTSDRAVALMLPKLLPLVAAMILYFVSVAVGLVLLVIPGILLLVSLSLFMVLIVVEDAPIFRSLIRSYQLIRGNWWRTAAIYTVIALASAIPWIVAGLVTVLLMALSGEPIVDPYAIYGMPLHLMLIASVFQMAANVVVVPLFLATGLCVYYELRARKEGADLEAQVASA